YPKSALAGQAAPYLATAPFGGTSIMAQAAIAGSMGTLLTPGGVRERATTGAQGAAFGAGGALTANMAGRVYGFAKNAYRPGLAGEFAASGGKVSPGQAIDSSVLRTGEWPQCAEATFDFKKVSGGLLVQSSDTGIVTAADLTVVSEKAPDDVQIRDLLFAWKVAKYVKSNAIVFCKDGRTIGIGAGQMSRVYSTKIAAIKAEDEGLSVKDSVMASDAFFPFRDGIDSAAEHGIAAIIQPGGSMRDNEVIAAANEHGLAMVFTGMRHFRH
ncbi:MAG: hypothetical protein IIC61_07330, partial [Proteobacteria bacterium]|nr:hypothetical protein [Pseudomonadota bacterium]